jgi:hypothetical protein
VAIHKDARALAARVNAVGDGWEATIVKGRGKHGGKAYVVRHRGRYVTRISGHASVLSLALTRAEATLRREGCPLPHKSITKKEDRMAAPTAAERAASDKLRPRLRDAVAGPGQYDFAKRAVDIIEASDLEQFGGGVAKSTPLEIANSTLGRFLEGGAFKQTNIDRFEYILERLNGDQPQAPEAAPEGEPVEGMADLRSQLAQEQELRQLAEETVGLVERERDEARHLAEVKEEARLSLVQRVDELAGKATALEQELESRPPNDDDLARRLDEQVAELARMEDELEAASGRAEALAEKAAKLEAEADGRKAVAELRGRYAEMLLNCVADGDAPSRWALDRLDRLTGLAD